MSARSLASLDFPCNNKVGIVPPIQADKPIRPLPYLEISLNSILGL